MKNNKLIYITIFLILILPSILFAVLIATDLPKYSSYLDLEKMYKILEIPLGLIMLGAKIGMVILTIWYGLEIGIKKIWAWILGFSTLFPFMIWISFIILLTYEKNKVPNTQRKDDQNYNFIAKEIIEPLQKGSWEVTAGELIIGLIIALVLFVLYFVLFNNISIYS